MNKNYEKIIKELERLNKVPVSELNPELSKLRMHLSDWEAFMNEYIKVPFYTKGYVLNKAVLNDKQYISLKEYRNVCRESSEHNNHPEDAYLLHEEYKKRRYTKRR